MHDDVDQLADEILAYVNQTDYVSFAELFRRLNHEDRLSGTHMLEVGGNIIVWAGISEVFMKAMLLLVVDRQLVTIQACSPLVYLVDGRALTLPIAKRTPPFKYKQPRWLPVCIRPAGATRKTKGGARRR